MTPMTPKEFADKMRKIYMMGDETGDVESGHCDADSLLCEFLRSNGFGEGIEIFEKLPKWYA